MTDNFSRQVRIAIAGLIIVAAPWGAQAGDGQVLHVGETTVLHMQGKGWALDRAGSSQTQLVAVQSTAGGAKFAVRGLKPGQAKLVFRSGQKTFAAHIDVLR